MTPFVSSLLIDRDSNFANESQVPRPSNSRHRRDRMFPGNLKIGTRLALAFGIIIPIKVFGIVTIGVSCLVSQAQSQAAAIEAAGNARYPVLHP
jgi:hypothetical protein